MYSLKPSRRQDILLQKIKKGEIKKIWWYHRKIWHRIEFITMTIIKKPRQMSGEFNHSNSLMFKHFLLDKQLKNTDTFLIQNLHEEKY